MSCWPALHQIPATGAPQRRQLRHVGEYLYRTDRAHGVGIAVAEACQAAVHLRDDELCGDKGIIALDPHGNIGLAFNTNVMRRAYRVGEAEPYVAIFRDE